MSISKKDMFIVYCKCFKASKNKTTKVKNIFIIDYDYQKFNQLGNKTLV